MFKHIPTRVCNNSDSKIFLRVAYIYGVGTNWQNLKPMQKRTKTIFTGSFILLSYGYLCRGLSIYFFWDSKAFGWLIFSFGIIFFLFDLNSYKKRKKQKRTWIGFLISVMLFGLVISFFIILNFYTSIAYKEAIRLLETNTIIRNEVGYINSVGLFPTGSIVELNNGASGNAVFYLTINGTKKFKDVKVLLEKKPQNNWCLISIQ